MTNEEAANEARVRHEVGAANGLVVLPKKLNPRLHISGPCKSSASLCAAKRAYV